MGTCDVELKFDTLTTGASVTQTGHLDLVGDDGTIPPFPKACSLR